MKKVNIYFNIHSLLHNNDVDAIEYLKKHNLYKKYKDFDKPIETRITNTIKLTVNFDDTIDYIKKKLALYLFDKIKIDEDSKKQKTTCFYCFKDGSTMKTNEIIKTREVFVNRILSKVKKQQDNEMKEELIEEKEDMEDIDEMLNDIDFSDLSDADYLNELDSLMTPSLEQNGGSIKNTKVIGEQPKNIMVCHNCKKIYFFTKYFSLRNYENFNDIYPFPELFHMHNNKDIFGYSLIDFQQKQIPLELEISKTEKIQITDPYVNIDKINREVLVKGKNKLNLFLNMVKDVDIKYYKYIKNDSYLLLNNYVDLTKKLSIDLYYFPEVALYSKKYPTKCLGVYTKLYWPFVDFENYFLKFIKHDMSYDIKSCILEKYINRDHEKYTVNDILINWGDKYKNYEKLIDNFEKVSTKSISEEYSNKVFYKINDNNDTNISVLFQNVYHLFDLDETIPYLSSYISKEGVLLEKMWKPLETTLKDKDWMIYSKNNINFRIKFNDIINYNEKDLYFQVNLYENMKMEANIVIDTEVKKFIGTDVLLKIKERINELVDRLNSINIFNFSGLSLQKLSLDNSKLTKENENTGISSMNFYMKLQSKLDKDKMYVFLEKLNKCMGVYFNKDFDVTKNNFRYTRINNIGINDITDRFIYYLHNIALEDNDDLNDNKIRKTIISSLMSVFDKSIDESIAIYESYKQKYKTFSIKPSSYGLYFNIKEPEEWKDPEHHLYNYKITVMGLRTYEDWNIMKNFIYRLFNLMESIAFKKMTPEIQKISKICNLYDESEQKEKVMFKKQIITENQQENMACKHEINEIDEEISKITDKKKIKELREKKSKLTKRKNKLKGEIDKQRKKYKQTHPQSVMSYLHRLQTVYPVLKLQCSSCGDNPKTKECLNCNIPPAQSQYSKQCQKKRQPMGTDMTQVDPEIINYDKEYELKRFEDFSKVKCKIDADKKKSKEQKGGTVPVKKYSKDIYENWGMENEPSLYPEKMSLAFCNNTHSTEIGKQGYKIKALKKIASLYDIDTLKMKKTEICEKIILKIKKSMIPDERGETLKILDNLLKSEKNIPKINMLKYLISFYQRETIFYKLEDNNFQSKIISELDIDISKDSLDKIKDTILLIFDNKKYPELVNKYINIFDLKNVEKYIENKKTIKNIIHFLTYHLTNDWTDKQKKYIYSNLKNTHSINSLKTINKYLKTYFDEINSNIISIESIYDPLKSDETVESSLNIEDFKKNVDLLTRHDKHNNAIQSTMSYKGKSISCPNYSDDKNHTLVGFLDINYENKFNYSDSKIRNIVCQPCCFVPNKDAKTGELTLDKKYVRNMNFCKGKMSWNDYLKSVEEETRAENYISTTTSANKSGTYGKLPVLLHNLFNNYTNLYNIRNENEIQNPLFTNFKSNLLKSPGFVMKGMRQSKDVLISIIAEMVEMDNDKVISLIEKQLQTNNNLFKSLNGGKLFIRFKTIENYINYLKTDKVESEWIVDIVSSPKLFKKYPNGINLFIFETTEEDVILQTYKSIDILEYYSPKKDYAFIYQFESGEMEPIILKYPTKKMINYIISSTNSNPLFIYNKKHINAQFLLVIKDMLKFIGLWVNNFSQETPINVKMLEKLKDTNYKPKKQIVDIFNKCIFILTESNKLIPTTPSKFFIDKPYMYITDESDINKYLLPLKETIAFYNKFSNDIDDENFEFTKIVLDKDNKKIEGVELLNKLIIPIAEPIRYNNNIHKKFIVSENKLYFKINNALYNKTMPKIDIDFLKEKYDFEIYNRLILEFSYFIDSNELQHAIIKELIIKNTYESKMRLKETIEDIVDNIIIFKEPELINYDKYLPFIQENNIREVCEVEHSFMCEKDGDKYKLVIPLNKKNIFIGLLVEALINNAQIREQILNNQVNRIVNVYNFINDERHVYHKKEMKF